MLTSAAPSFEQLKDWFPNSFATNTDSSILGFEAHLNLKEGSAPIFSRAYTVPYGLLAKVDAHLDNLVVSGKVMPISHSEWASPAVIVHKANGEIRYCVD